MCINEKFDQAVLLHRNGQLEQALTIYEDVIQRDRMHSGATHNRGVIALAMGDNEKAVIFLKQAILAKPDRPVLWNQLALAYERMGYDAELVEEYRTQAQFIQNVENITLTDTSTLETGLNSIDAWMSDYKQGNWLTGIIRCKTEAEKRQKNFAAGLGYAWFAAFLNEPYVAHSMATSLIKQGVDKDICSLILSRTALNQGLIDEAKVRFATVENRKELSVEIALLEYQFAIKENNLHKGERLLRSLYKNNPNHAAVLLFQAEWLIQKNDWEAGRDLLENLCSAVPGFSKGWMLLGYVLRRLSKPEKAEQAFMHAIASNPRDASGCTVFSEMLLEQGRIIEAEYLARMATLAQSHYGAGWMQYLRCVRTLHGISKAMDILRKIPMQAQSTEVFSRFAALLASEARDLSLTEHYALAAISRETTSPQMWQVLAICREKQFDLSGAKQAAWKALDISNNDAERCASWRLLGGIASTDKDSLFSEYAIRKALSINSEDVLAKVGLAECLIEARRLAEAEDLARSAHKAAPNSALAKTQLARALFYRGEWEEPAKLYEEALLLTEPNIRDAVWEGRLYCLSYHPDKPAAEIAQAFFDWGHEMSIKHAHARIEMPAKPLQGKLRVGILSPDLNAHTSANAFLPLFKSAKYHDVELIAFSNNAKDDNVTTKLKPYFSNWHDIRHLSDDEVTQLVRSQNINVLIDACNHMKDTRIALLARRLAPVQVTWLGSTWTSGLKEVDYVIMNHFMVPDGAECLFSEKVIRLPKSTCSIDRSDNVEIYEAPYIKNGYVTFGHYGRPERFNYRCYELWSKLLNTVTDARLILDFRTFEDKPTRERFYQQLKRYSVPVERVILRYSHDVFKAFGDIDVTIDSIPHAGGTVSVDSFWAGVPVVTLADRPPVGRIGVWLNSLVGLHNMIANNEQELIEMLVHYARDPSDLIGLRYNLRDIFKKSALMDIDNVHLCYFNALKFSYLRASEGHPPIAFDVNNDGTCILRNT